MSDRNFDEIWAAFLSGQIADDDVQALNKKLAGDSETRDNALLDDEMHGMLGMLGRTAETEDDFVSRVTGQLCGSNNAPVPPPVQKPAVTPVQRRRRSQNHHAQLVAVISAVALACLLIVVSMLMFSSNSQPIADPQKPSPPPKQNGATNDSDVAPDWKVANKTDDKVDDPVVPPNLIENPATPNLPNRPRKIVQLPKPSTNQNPRKPQTEEFFARIIGGTDAVWESESPSQLADDELRLSSGIAEISMTSGASLILHGPAVMRCESSNRIELSRGRVVASVPKRAIGFTVDTPSSQIVDLGTEFSVDVDEAGATDVEVTRGQVEVANNKGDKKWNLTAGDYKWVAKNGEMSFDWRLGLTIDDKTFVGSKTFNGETVTIASAKDYVALYPKIVTAFSRLRPKFDRRTRPDSYRASLNINGETSSMANIIEYSRAYRRVMNKLNDLLTKASKGNGSFNFDGDEFRFNSFDDLMRIQEEIMRRAMEDLGTEVPRVDSFEGLRGRAEDGLPDPFERLRPPGKDEK